MHCINHQEKYQFDYHRKWTHENLIVYMQHQRTETI